MVLTAGTQGSAQPPVQVCIIGDDAEARALEAVAMARFAVNKSVIRLRHNQLGALPPTLAETLPHLPGIAAGGSCAVVCSGQSMVSGIFLIPHGQLCRVGYARIVQC